MESLEARLALAAVFEVRLTVTDPLGNPIESIAQGGDFMLRATVEDLRPAPQGVFAAYVDVNYDAAKAAVDGPIAYGLDYPNGREGDTSTPGIINEVGAFADTTPVGGGLKLLFAVPFTATGLGTLDFTLDHADVSPAHDSRVFCLPSCETFVNPADIQFVNDSIQIVPPVTQVEVKLVATDLDGNPIDSITAGTDFLLQATVKDVRPARSPIGNPLRQ